MSAQLEPALVPLTNFRGGTQVQLEALRLGVREAQRMREMGLREGVTVSILQNAGKLIIRAGESRIGLRSELAMLLFGRAVSRA